MRDQGRLAYYLPEKPRERTQLRIPESHTLYIGPPACARRHILYAELYGGREHCSSLCVTESDLISGDYEGMILNAVTELLELLQPRPRVLLLVFFCIDDFVGTDEAALLAALEEHFPEQVFAVDRVNPISVRSTAENTVMSKQFLQLYRFLRPETEHDRGVTFIGNFVPLAADCELNRWLQHWGFSDVRELFRCHDYEAYQSLARSGLCLAFRFPGADTLQYFQAKLGMPTFFFPPEYDAGRVREGYTALSVLLGYDVPGDLDALYRETEQDVRETAALFRKKNIRLALDSKAFLRPFFAGKALLDGGFPLAYVFHGRRIWEEELPIMEELKSRGVQVLRKDDFQNLALHDAGADCLAIGSDCQKLLESKYYADVWHDEGYFGFHGIHRLMALLRQEVNKAWES